MPETSLFDWGQVARTARRSGPLAGPPPWARLERLMADLDAADGRDRQTRALLDAVRDLTGADEAVWVPAGDGPPLAAAGSQLPPADARRVVDRLLEAGSPADSTLATTEFGADALADLFRDQPGPAPTAAVLARVGRSAPAWMAALAFSPDRPLAGDAVGRVRVAARAARGRQQAARAAADLSEALFGVVQGFAAAIDAKDPYTYGHSERVARMATRIGRQMGLPAGTVSNLYLAGLLHDIGKIGVPEAVLRKPGRLTDEEFAQVQAHPVIGDRILAGIRQLAHARPGVRSHHERVDGLGYPDRLAGDAVPLLGRVLAVADTCDAMLSARPYRPPLDPLAVETELARGRGAQWDPAVVDGFFGCRHEIYAIRQTGLGASVYQAVNHAVAAAERAPDR